jgi:hypothetical protein
MPRCIGIVDPMTDAKHSFRDLEERLNVYFLPLVVGEFFPMCM